MRRFFTRRLMAAYAAIIALVVAGLVILARQGGASVQYRTAVATMGTVTQSVAISGNLASAAETDLDFDAAGKVNALNVSAGQPVTPGQVLATLDTTSLQAALLQAQATLASAQAKLSQDQAGTTPTSLQQAQAQVNTASVSLQNAQTAYNDTVSVNQSSVAQSQAQLAQDQNAENTDCNASPPAAACPADQAKVNTDSANVSSAETKATQSDDQASAQVSSTKVALQNAQASVTALEQGASAQQIQQDQAQVQIDQIAEATAQTNVNGATITAPVAGQVEEVSISVGQQVSAGSSGSSGTGASSSSASSSSSSSNASTHAIVLITPGLFEVTGSVSDAQVDEITVGQSAQVLPAGSQEAVPGKVTAVAPVATVSSGVATFPVTVVLNGTNPSLRSGMSASVNIIVNQVVQVLTVPTSAVHTTGAGSTVQVLVNGRAQARSVTVGASDATRTQILSGVSDGDQVVIATITGTVPASGSGATGARGLGGGLGGGGTFAGGGGRGFAGGGGGGG